MLQAYEQYDWVEVIIDHKLSGKHKNLGRKIYLPKEELKQHWANKFSLIDAKLRELANYKPHSGNAICVKLKYRTQPLSYKVGSKS